MRSKKTIISILLILLFGAAGIGVTLTLAQNLSEEPRPQPEYTTRFYVISESEMILGEPAFYRTIIENQEGTTVDYDLKVRSAGEIVYDQKIKLNSRESSNQTISFIPDYKDNYQKLEFVLYKNNEPYRTRVFQISRYNDYSSGPDTDMTPTPPQNTDSMKNPGIEFIENYSKQRIGDNIIYTFNTGEKLELKISNGIVNKEDAVYTTGSAGNNIIFLGEMYEKILPTTAKYMNPVIMNASSITLKLNNTLNLKNDYAITLNSIDDKSLKFTVSIGNRISGVIVSLENSPAEYWKQIGDYRKQKIIRITPRTIDRDEIAFDLIQYAGDNVVKEGDKYGEFQITNITENHIILKNIQEIKIEPGKEISLAKGKMKIMV